MAPPTLLSCLLLLLVLFHAGDSQSVIKSLPGFPGDLPFKLETGYVGIGKSEDLQLFYYFIESERDPEDDPLLLWLNGGPGCSGFYGIVYEIGPLLFDYANSEPELPTLVLNPYSWTKFANIIFVDAPVGTGFSYSRSWEGYFTDDKLSAVQTYNFLRKWLTDHPKFLKNSLYITGDSYSGIVIPIIVQEIANGMEMGHMPQMNLKGYLLGNPLTDAEIDSNSKVSYAHRMSLISDEIYESAKRSCNGKYTNVDPGNGHCLNDLQVISKCDENIYVFHILEPNCPFYKPNASVLRLNPGSILENIPTNLLLSGPEFPEKGCKTYNYLYVHFWANNETVQAALHVREGTKNMWLRCNESMPSYKSLVSSTVDYHRNLSNKGLRVLIYSGDHDYNVPHLGTEAWIKSLNLAIRTDWRPWSVKRQVGGYTMTYSSSNSSYSLTFATVMARNSSIHLQLGLIIFYLLVVRFIFTLPPYDSKVDT